MENNGERLRSKHYWQYLELRNNPDYADVTLDEKTGGVSAVHRNHKFDSEIGAYGVKIGYYERLVVKILRERGHFIVLESEIAPNGVKTPDGKLDGLVMDIKSTDGVGKWAIKDKFHDAVKQGAECVILYFHRSELYSQGRVQDGWDKFLKDKTSHKYPMLIRRVICVVGQEVVEFNVPK